MEKGPCAPLLLIGKIVSPIQLYALSCSSKCFDSIYGYKRGQYRIDIRRKKNLSGTSTLLVFEIVHN